MAAEELTKEQFIQQMEEFDQLSGDEQYLMFEKSQNLITRYLDGDKVGLIEELATHPMTTLLKFFVLEGVKQMIHGFNVAINDDYDKDVNIQNKNNANEALKFFESQPPNLPQNGGRRRRSRRRKSRRRRSRRY